MVYNFKKIKVFSPTSLRVQRPKHEFYKIQQYDLRR